PIAKGQTIQRDDLASRQVAGLDEAVAASDMDTVVGTTAAVDVTAGQVLTGSMVTADPVPASGQAVVGLQVTAAQMPGDRLAAGDFVRVVRVPAGDGSATSEDADTVLA